MKKRIVRVLVLLMVLVLPVIIYAVSLAPYTDSVTRANNYINKFSDRKKFLIFNKNYVYEKDGFGDSGEFKTGGMVSKSEYDLTVYENQSYLATGKEYWTLTSNGSNKYYIESFIQSKAQNSNSGTRVTQFINPGTIIKGRGTFANPWTFEEGYEVEIKPNNSSFGSVSPNETKYVKAGSSLEYVLTPTDGYFYNGKKDDCNLIKVGGDIHENKYELSNINRDINCTAVFELRTYKFSLNIKDDAKDYKGVKKIYSTDPGYNPIYYKHKKDWYSDANTTNPITKINVPVVTGWTFEGYYYGSTKIIDSNGDIINKNLPISDFVITNQAATAQLSKNTFTISYNLNGGVSGSKKPTSSLYDEVIEIDNPTRAGYSFAGWSFNGNSNTAKYGETSSNINSIFAANSTKTKARYFANLNPTNNASVTLTANWESCPAGTYNDGTSTTCTQCPAGTYTTTPGNAACTQCDKGYYCGGGTEKAACPAGTYRNTTGGKSIHDCSQCEIGSYTNETGQISCKACQPTGQTGTNGLTNAIGSTSCNSSCNNAHVSTWETAVWNTNNTLTNTCRVKTCVTGYSLNNNICGANTYTISYAGMDGATHGSSHPTTATYDAEFAVNNPAKTGYTFTGWKITGMDSVTHTYGSNTTTATSINSTKETLFKNLRSTSGTVTFTATWSINQYTLTINPNGGTWGGKTTNSTITQNYNTTYTVTNPTAGPTYTITYNANSQGATYTASPTSVQRPFTSWTKSGTGTFSGTTFTFGAGSGTLTANYNTTSNSFNLPAINKTGYTCKWAQGSATGTQYAGGTSRTITANTTFYAVCTINAYTLTVKPNGGTWNGATTDQPFTQNYNTTKTIANPSAGPTYTISYNANSQGATYTASPTSVQRPFTSWTNSGSGTLSGTTYTFGAGAGTLTANYNTTSNSFTLPKIEKTGYTCQWAKGSASGTKINGNTSTTITANTTFYAVCTINQYTLTVNPNGGTWSGSTASQTFKQNYATTKTIAAPTATPSYTISYNANSQGATYTASPTSVTRPFSSWTKSGSGSISGTTYTYGPGDGTLTAAYNGTSNSFTLPTITKTGYTCKWAQGSATGTQYDGGSSRTITGNTTFYAVCTIKSISLTVQPNGGTWGGKTTNSTITQNYNTTYTVAAPTATPTYTITYNANSQGTTYTASPTSVSRPFTGWTKSGSGTWNASTNTYTFGDSAGTLTAGYNTTSASFTLPSISKTGYTCKWAEGSTSGTQYAGGTSRTITSNKTYYAISSINSYTLTINPNGGTWGGKTTNSTVTQNYNTTYTVANPTAGPTYTITYNANSQGATYTASPTSVQRQFTSWTKSGAGTLSGTTYTFGAGAGTLTANYNGTSNSFALPAISKTGYTCKWAQGSASGTQYAGGTARTITANTTFYAVCSINQYTLTVNPNGGTWNGSTATQTFKQNYGTTKTIAAPTATPTYTITYNANSQGATYTASPTSVSRPFTSWSKSGSGTISGTTFTYGAGDTTLTANYNGTSASFTLPSINKTGYTCKWAQGSASGTQYAGGTARTITANTTFYAVCSINQYTLTVAPNGGTWSGSTSNQTFNQNYNTTKTIANPTAGPTYTISYNANSQGATYTASPTSVQRSFTSWTKSGTGTLSGTTFTYGAGNGTLTANYNGTSNSFTLPAITKSGSTCKWAEGSASGTQYEGGTSRTITANKTYYAVCTATYSCPDNTTLVHDASLGYICTFPKGVTTVTIPGVNVPTVTFPSGCADACGDLGSYGCINSDANGCIEAAAEGVSYLNNACLTACVNGNGNVGFPGGTAQVATCGEYPEYNQTSCYMEVNSVTITFNANGGSVSPTATILKIGNSYGSLPTPSRTDVSNNKGYTFAGWYTAASGGTRVTSSSIVPGKTTLYAHWNLNRYCSQGNISYSSSLKDYACLTNAACYPVCQVVDCSSIPSGANVNLPSTVCMCPQYGTLNDGSYGVVGMQPGGSNTCETLALTE